MKIISRVLITLIASAAIVLPARSQSVSTLENVRVETYFSPNGGATEAIANLIDGASSRVWLAGYGFSSAPIAKALAAAYERGVDVRLVLDSSNRKVRYSQAPQLHKAGLDVRTNSRYAIMHHKFVIVDQSVVLGSMNFTVSGENRNAENTNVFAAANPLAQTYVREFMRLHREAEPFVKL